MCKYNSWTNQMYKKTVFSVIYFVRMYYLYFDVIAEMTDNIKMCISHNKI